ncbi:MAG: sigma-70 family RNA polymerase sigma factor [Bacteroidetes bacterium]|nr:sigma-70 family RNA polymerase sigma factor [Bacteroidota bacterium]MBS1740222.1 sigma-70 family RNA polymerase sigma factor [Bacteroidota bacterium]
MKPLTSMPPLDDHDIIQEILTGNKKKFAVLMRKYNQLIFRVGMSLLHDSADVEDAMQSTYISAYTNLAQFSGRSTFGTWLTRIMMNHCKDVLRKNTPETLIEINTDHYVSQKTPAKILANKELRHALEAAIEDLPEKYRLVFVLREIEELSVRDTSHTLDIEEANVKVRLNRAKAMLRTKLQPFIKEYVYPFHLTRCDHVVNKVENHLGFHE